MARILFYARARIQLRAALRQKGYSFAEAIALSNSVDTDTIDATVVEANAVNQVNAIGDGKIIGAIIDFFNSPLGKTIIDLLLKLLIGGLMTHDAEADPTPATINAAYAVTVAP